MAYNGSSLREEFKERNHQVLGDHPSSIHERGSLHFIHKSSCPLMPIRKSLGHCLCKFFHPLTVNSDQRRLQSGGKHHLQRSKGCGDLPSSSLSQGHHLIIHLPQLTSSMSIEILELIRKLTTTLSLEYQHWRSPIS